MKMQLQTIFSVCHIYTTTTIQVNLSEFDLLLSSQIIERISHSHKNRHAHNEIIIYFIFSTTEHTKQIIEQHHFHFYLPIFFIMQIDWKLSLQQTESMKRLYNRYSSHLPISAQKIKHIKYTNEKQHKKNRSSNFGCIDKAKVATKYSSNIQHIFITQLVHTVTSISQFILLGVNSILIIVVFIVVVVVHSI